MKKNKVDEKIGTWKVPDKNTRQRSTKLEKMERKCST